MDTFLITGPAPNRIVREVARGHATKDPQPAMKTAVVAIDVLDVDGTQRLPDDALACAQLSTFALSSISTGYSTNLMCLMPLLSLFDSMV